MTLVTFDKYHAIGRRGCSRGVASSFVVPAPLRSAGCHAAPIRSATLRGCHASRRAGRGRPPSAPWPSVRHRLSCPHGAIAIAAGVQYQRVVRAARAGGAGGCAPGVVWRRAVALPLRARCRLVGGCLFGSAAGRLSRRVRCCCCSCGV